MNSTLLAKWINDCIECRKCSVPLIYQRLKKILSSGLSNLYKVAVEENSKSVTENKIVTRQKRDELWRFYRHSSFTSHSGLYFAFSVFYLFGPFFIIVRISLSPLFFFFFFKRVIEVSVCNRIPSKARIQQTFSRVWKLSTNQNYNQIA